MNKDHILQTLSVFIRRVCLLFYGPVAFLYTAMPPFFCSHKPGFKGWYWGLVQKMIRVLLWALSIRVDIDDASLASLSTQKGHIIVGNHTSNLDFLAFMAVLPADRWVTFGAKIEVNKAPFFKRACASVGILMIDRRNGKPALESLIEKYSRADSRLSLFLFPEGTRIDGDVMGPFKIGAVKVAQVLEKDIQPLCFFGANDLMPRGAIIPKAGVVSIRVLDNVQVGMKTDLELQTTALRDCMMDYYSKHVDQIRRDALK